jgi:hypothetical protein
VLLEQSASDDSLSSGSAINFQEGAENLLYAAVLTERLCGFIIPGALYQVVYYITLHYTTFCLYSIRLFSVGSAFPLFVFAAPGIRLLYMFAY